MHNISIILVISRYMRLHLLLNVVIFVNVDIYNIFVGYLIVYANYLLLHLAAFDLIKIQLDF